MSLNVNPSYENAFSLHVHFHANQTHSPMKSFARRLVLKQRQMTTQKWVVSTPVHCTVNSRYSGHLGRHFVSRIVRVRNTWSNFQSNLYRWGSEFCP